MSDMSEQSDRLTDKENDIPNHTEGVPPDKRRKTAMGGNYLPRNARSPKPSRQVCAHGKSKPWKAEPRPKGQREDRYPPAAISLKRSPSRPLGFRRIGPGEKGKGKNRLRKKGRRSDKENGKRADSRDLSTSTRGRKRTRVLNTSFRVKSRVEMQQETANREGTHKKSEDQKCRRSFDSRTLDRVPTKGTKMTPKLSHMTPKFYLITKKWSHTTIK